MREMRGSDAYFLREESRARHMHTLKVVVVDPATANEKPRFSLVRERAARLMPHLAAFRRRPVRIPLGIGHPLWIEAPELDVDYHFRHVVLPPGAGDEALDELMGQVASEPLDEERPLWQLFFVEGLPEERIAYVTKIHHALADGAAAAELVARLFQTTPEPVQIPEPPQLESERAPAPWGRLAAALRRELGWQRKLPGLLRRSLRGIRIGIARRRAGLPMPPHPFRAPPTRFNRPLTPSRVFAHATLPLAELRRVKSAFGCTINDVYVALVGGSVRHYLEQRGELPALPLTAAVPVAVRRETDDPAFGNATATWFTSTGSDVADPVERLRAVTASTRAARDLFAERDPHLAPDWLDLWLLRRLYLTGFQGLAHVVLRRPSFNLIISNVRGPSSELYSDGGRVVALRSMGPLAAQQGLNFTAWSYRDDFAVGVHACREHVPELRTITERLPLELQALERAAETARAPD